MKVKNMKFRLPAEWETHEATWIGWPYNKNDWPGKFSPIPYVFAEIVKKLVEGEQVYIIVQNENHKKSAIQILKKVGVDFSQISFVTAKTDRNWLRDAAPFFVKNESGKVVPVKFNFNAWAKYKNFKLDRKIPEVISKVIGKELVDATYKNNLVTLEGGAIDTNGRGSLITTEECLLDKKTQTRNPGFTKSDYQKVFEKYLGIKNIIWLKKGIVGDDTHGHIDDVCRFVNEKTLLLCIENNPYDENYKILNENKEILQDARLEDGSKVEVIELPMPEPLYFEGQRLPASYANFYISNSYVLVPTFNDVKDRVALGILSELFRDRKVVGIHSVDLVWGLGTIHCLTHEQPAVLI
ncbi:MAG: agmatine deiminase family protein [Ignavibacteria bacterium]|nr:agmatine deiminase family protein [Ignavibacteria bacterium]